jgi:hypothetical protein
VHVRGNRFFGTVQAITNTAGDRWVIAHNDIHDLTLFDCTAGLCAGGDGIIVGPAVGTVAAPGGPAAAVNRSEGNFVFANEINGTIPDGFDEFSMVGIFVFGADDTVVRDNRIAIPDNPSSTAAGEGVLVSNSCCGNPDDVVVPGSRNTLVLFNEGRASGRVLNVEGTGGENTQGLVRFGNRGVELIEGILTEDPGNPHRGRRPHARRFGQHRRQRLF